MKHPTMSSKYALTILVMLMFGASIGAEIVYVAIFMGRSDFRSAFGKQSLFMQGFMTASFPATASAVFLSVRISEKTVLQWCSILWLAGYMTSSLVNSLAWFLTGRVIKGLVLGVISSTLPSYVCKVFPPRLAGYCLTAIQGSIPFGMLMLGSLSAIGQGLFSFRLCWLVGIAPLMPLPLLNLFILDCVASEDEIQPEKPISNTKRMANSLSTFFGCIIQIMAQFTGINIIMYYLTHICIMSGFKAHQVPPIALGIYMINTLCTMLSLFIIHRYNVLVLLKTGIASLGTLHASIFMVILAGLATSQSNDLELRSIYPSLGIFVLILCYIFVGTFALTIAGPTMMYTSEIIASDNKKYGIATAMSAGWTANSFLAIIGPCFFSYLHYGIFLVFCFICLFFLLALNLVPEV